MKQARIYNLKEKRERTDNIAKQLLHFRITFTYGPIILTFRIRGVNANGFKTRIPKICVWFVIGKIASSGFGCCLFVRVWESVLLWVSINSFSVILLNSRISLSNSCSRSWIEENSFPFGLGSIPERGYFKGHLNIPSFPYTTFIWSSFIIE
jgi:hypothetical protein